MSSIITTGCTTLFTMVFNFLLAFRIGSTILVTVYIMYSSIIMTTSLLVCQIYTNVVTEAQVKHVYHHHHNLSYTTLFTMVFNLSLEFKMGSTIVTVYMMYSSIIRKTSLLLVCQIYTNIVTEAQVKHV